MEEECGQGTPRCFVGYATNGNVCVSFLIFSRCLFCKTGTSAGGAPPPSLSLSLHTLSFYLSAGKCHLTLFFLPHDFSGFVFPFICITNYAGSRSSTFPHLQSFFSLFIYWQLQASGGRRFLSSLSLSHPAVNIVLQFNYFSFSCFVFFNRRRRQRQRQRRIRLAEAQ